jgi:hypothetical protein
VLVVVTFQEELIAVGDESQSELRLVSQSQKEGDELFGTTVDQSIVHMPNELEIPRVVSHDDRDLQLEGL